ncbi:MAG: bifunctional phosphoglucose/phosphomannose isomerase [Candidatus Ryanbacteria bacterium RIFCSPLOWO2_01_FULL_48_26]|uniref:Bifunctional phosphoglucose/phosphomannose isomerase n=1 Tax=Candidatus Ryanbacteria bacterium RIFCSPLOWO2_01_FULL_48_26 TaxID=1802126 RepID=A0A1G2GX51_9BACT|nr:MAG: bifunctional phosphoglucose/phosphomannose isomerase [Candidatus Ryanbacteria bacterium RIFCSPLOWO2_01_FULL_48_26]
MIYSDIKNFARQFEWEPKIENKPFFGKKYAGFIVAGMGGSHLAADIIRCWLPECDLMTWENYGLPPLEPKELKKRLIIASSYSGNTEETIDAASLAHKNGYPLAVLASGGKFLEFAKENKIPYVQLPHQDIQPRMALGWSIRAMLAVMDKIAELGETSLLQKLLQPEHHEKEGNALAQKLKGSVPIIYSSARNSAIAKIWKIKFNETGKIPAFYNVFPELNHNEMTGFDIQPVTAALSKNFHCVILRDNDDDTRVQKRMEILRSLYEKRGLRVEEIQMKESPRLHKIFSAIVLADWVSYYTAQLYKVEPEQVPMVEEFKKLIISH